VFLVGQKLKKISVCKGGTELRKGGRITIKERVRTSELIK
jgi:hypothetical protein